MLCGGGETIGGWERFGAKVGHVCMSSTFGSPILLIVVVHACDHGDGKELTDSPPTLTGVSHQ